MILDCQKEAIEQLNILSQSDRHSILIEGPEGTGKSYLANMYAKNLGIEDFEVVKPTVSDIREAVETCMNLSNKIVLCIENLDTGVASASYALLKFLEEPINTAYIVVTCRNIKKIPDTIISRSSVVSCSALLPSDIEKFAEDIDVIKYSRLQNTRLWRCVRTLSEIKLVLSMTDDKLSYFDKMDELCKFNDSVSNLVWKFSHFEDNSETPIALVIKYISDVKNSANVRSCAANCLKEITQARIAKHTVLTKFMFECKYTE